VPGQSYGSTIYLRIGGLGIGRPSGPAFEGLVLGPGEVRDLGDLRLPTPANTGTKPGTGAVSPVPGTE
jgi:hypothetical protein